MITQEDTLMDSLAHGTALLANLDELDEKHKWCHKLKQTGKQFMTELVKYIESVDGCFPESHDMSVHYNNQAKDFEELVKRIARMSPEERETLKQQMNYVEQKVF